MDKVTNKQELEDLIARSRQEPVVIFKHSTTCPISADAYKEMARFTGDVALIEVQNAREVSRELEARTGVDHESPQVIILRNGRAVWHASHWKIRSDTVRDALAGNQ